MNIDNEGVNAVEVITDWRGWLESLRAKSTMSVKLKGLDQLSSSWLADVLALFGIAWHVLKSIVLGLFTSSTVPPDPAKDPQEWSLQKDPETGMVVFQKNGGGFHRAVGLEVFTQAREIPAWSQLILVELGGGGYVVMACDEAMERFIITAREEPGNNGEVKKHILLGAPLQTSIANAQKAHGGNPPPRSEWMLAAEVEDQPQDGGRYLDKVNHVGCVKIDLKDPNLKLADNERIFTRAELGEAIRAGECNSHLAEVCGHLFT